MDILKGIGAGTNAKATIDALAGKLSAADEAAAAALVAKVAGEDGNGWLSDAEASMLADAFVGTVSVAAAGSKIDARLAALRASGNDEGLAVHFTSAKEDLEGMIVSGLEDTVKAAAGRPFEVNVSIYEFQSQRIADELLKIAREHPEAKIRMIADFSQSIATTKNQIPQILAIAKKEKLQNFDIRFKKDAPYSWNAKLKRPSYDHARSSGLNHHKGVVTLIDGQPFKVMTGSFNWSKTANSQNYEDLTVGDAHHPAARLLAADWNSEFAAFFSGPDALTPSEASVWKTQVRDAIFKQNHITPPAHHPTKVIHGAVYQPAAIAPAFDVNGIAASDRTRLGTLIPLDVVRDINAEQSARGRFASMDELIARVPSVAGLSADQKAKLAGCDFGPGKVMLNLASADDLVSVGVPKTVADAIVATRAAKGDFQAVSDLKGMAGLTDARFAAIAPLLDASVDRIYFNSRPFGDPTGGTGYDPNHASATLPVENPDGSFTVGPASVTNAAVDLLNRAQPGQPVHIAMYALQTGTPEFTAIVAAAKRGVDVKLVLNEGNDATVAYIKTLQAAGVSHLAVRIQTAKTMHEKFGVFGDDVFTGSANFSMSAGTKHSEERLVLKNDAALSAAYSAEFDRLWAKSKDPA